ncbi:hypothetical protein SOVF_125880 [Spinacia oleracea]|nr:hypothetical protein SOVF_125880 [Spinacia oleracea]
MGDCDWSALPVDILGEIVLKLESPQDILYFSAICFPPLLLPTRSNQIQHQR